MSFMVRVVLDISQNNARYPTVTSKPLPLMGVHIIGGFLTLAASSIFFTLVSATNDLLGLQREKRELEKSHRLLSALVQKGSMPLHLQFFDKD